MKQPLIKTRFWNDISFEETEELLLSSQIKKIIPVYEYLNIPDRGYNPTAFLLFLDKGLKAVFKPDRYPHQIQSALTAYRFSQFMNFKFVPPTVTRTINGKNGIVRFFVEDVDDLQHKFVEHLTPSEKSDIYTFYFVLGECDANRYNVLFEASSGKPVLVDNETSMTASFIPYGDYPFRSLQTENLEISISSAEEYERFPLNAVRELSDYSTIYLRKVFYDMDESEFNRYFIPWYIKRLTFLNGPLSFVRWKNSYWIRKNFMYYTQIYKNFLPEIFSEKTMERLKALEYKTLNSLLPLFSIPKAIVFGILHRRDVLLKEAFRLNKFCA